MNVRTAVAALRAQADARRTDREQRRRLECELAGYTTAAEIAELESMLSRHSAEEIRDVEAILVRQAARRRHVGAGYVKT
jgi:hypothetical protein